MPPKFRLFGGPNGSGKTFLFDQLKQGGVIHTELYINADRILRDMKERGDFSFNAYRVKSTENEFKSHVLGSGLLKKMEDQSFLDSMRLKAGILDFGISIDSLNAYHASFVASYLVDLLMATGQSFCFETVMSHEGKVALFDQAKTRKYKTYLYFVYTTNPELNVARVKIRAADGLHDVENGKIRDRYTKSFSLLPAAFAKADEAFVIDNSTNPTIIIQKKKSLVSHLTDDLPKGEIGEILNSLL